VSTIKIYHVQLDEPNERRALETLEDMCEKLLANPVIHNYSVKIL
jgi:phosphoribosylformylglycinamidine synthase